MTRLFGGVLIVVGMVTLGWSVSPDDPPAGDFGGDTLFASWGCTGCHRGPDHRAAGTVGPDLGALTASPGDVRRSIEDPSAVVVPGYPAMMPRLPLSDTDVDRLVAYLTADR